MGIEGLVGESVGAWLAELAARIGITLPGGGRPPEAEPGQTRAITARGDVDAVRYFLGPDPVPPPADAEPHGLPDAYGVDRIVLLARDPWCLFTYWEVTAVTRADALSTLGSDARLVLRVQDVTFLGFTGDNAWPTTDVEPPPGATSAYVQVPRPAASYCADVGLRTASGRFLSLARSNAVTTPAATPSPDDAVRWVGLDGPAARADAAPGDAPPPPAR